MTAVDLERAQHLLDLHRPAEAERILRTHLSSAPGDVAALAMLGEALHDLGHLAEAERTVRAALAGSPQHFRSLLVLSDVLDDRDDARASRKLGESMLQSHPAEWVSHFVMGRALLLGRPRAARALDHVTRGLGLAPHQPELHNLAGNCFHAMRHRGKAEAAWREALRLDPHHGPARANLASHHAENGRLREASRSVTGALRATPQDKDLHRVLAQVMVALAWFALWGLILGMGLLYLEAASGTPWLLRVVTWIAVLGGVALYWRPILRRLPPRPQRWTGTLWRLASWPQRILAVILGPMLLVVTIMAFGPARAAAEIGTVMLGILLILAGLLTSVGLVVIVGSLLASVGRMVVRATVNLGMLMGRR